MVLHVRNPERCSSLMGARAAPVPLAFHAKRWEQKMSAMKFTLGKRQIADIVARSALHVPALEKIIAIACRQPRLRWLGLGAVAHGYSRVLQRRELRIADFGTYRLWVNVAEPLGIEPFFFGQS